jgi:alginate O-acetyltransferase complex protein AlgI
MNAILDILSTTPRWALMWAMAVVVFYTGKAAMWLMTPAPKGGRNALLAAGWWLAWPGMSLTGWSKWTNSAEARAEAPAHWVAGLRNLLFGTALLWGVARLFTHPLAAGWVGMVGFIFIFHFGFFRLVTGFWSGLGQKVKPVMRNPLAAVTLAEFWGQRWNTAFRDLSHRVLFLPAARRWGEAGATWFVFAVSGLVHELLISVPAGAGYGLPTAYFLVQGAGLMMERRYCTLPTTIKHIRTVLFTALPAFFLFHPPFVEGVMVPFFHAIGALP